MRPFMETSVRIESQKFSRTWPNQEYSRHPLPAVSRLESILAAVGAEIAAHSRRTGRLALGAARALKLDDVETRQLGLAARLHDVGKICIPRRLLWSSAALSPEEQGWLRQHATIGELMVARILKDREVLLGIRHHHERFDG